MMLKVFNVIYPGDDELSSYYNDIILTELRITGSYSHILIAAGERGPALKLKESLLTAGLHCAVFYLGKVINKNYDEHLISILKAVEFESDDVLVFDIDTGADFLLSNVIGGSALAQIWTQLKSIKSASKSQSLSDVKLAVSCSNVIISEIVNKDIQSALAKSLSLANLLLCVEHEFTFGKEIRTLSSFPLDKENLVKINNIDEVINFDYSFFFSTYTALKSKITSFGKCDISAIDGRISFLDSALIFSKSLANEIGKNAFPKMFVWLSVYCLNLSLVYKRRGEYTAGFSLTLRALEFYCQGLLIFANEASFDTYGRFFVGSKKPSGAGEIWDCACAKISVITTSGIDKAKIKNFARLRNSSLFGHGSMQCNEDMYDDAFSTIKLAIEAIDKAYAPPPEQFVGLMNYCKNLFTDLDKLVIASVFHELALYELQHGSTT